MRVLRSDEFWIVSRITGMSHNFLGLLLEECPGPPPILELLPPSGECSHESLDGAEVIRAVMAAVEESNRILGSSYSVRQIRIVSNDTPPESVYGSLAAAVVEHVHALGDAFGK
jgi:hypothetical protein